MFYPSMIFLILLLFSNNRPADSGVTLQDISSSFPLAKVGGQFHFRFRTSVGKRETVWQDVINPTEKIPTYHGNIFLKALRLNDLGISPKSGGASAAAAPVASKPTASPITKSVTPKKTPPAAEAKINRSAPVAKPSEEISGLQSTGGVIHTPKSSTPKAKAKPVTPKAATVKQTTPKPAAKPVAKPKAKSKAKPSNELVASSSSDDEEEDLFGGNNVKNKLDADSNQLTGVDLSDKSEEVQHQILKAQKELKKKQMEALKEIEERKNQEEKRAEDKEKCAEKWEKKIQVWSEENGIKRSIQALLASLHTILWEDAGWKPLNIGDLMNDNKIKIYYFKASRIVHPDKAIDYTPEQQYIAERVFDALSQGWNKFQAEKSGPAMPF